MRASLDHLVIVWLQIVIQEPLFQEDLKSVFHEGRVLFHFSLAHVETEANFLNLFDSCHRNLGQRFVATSDGIAPALVELEGFLTHSHPSRDELRVNARLILQQLSLE